MQPRAYTQEQLYRTLHWCHPAYQQHNCGLSCLPRWRAALPPAGARVLEIGCGNGTLCARLAGEGYDVTGVDLVAGPYERKGYAFAVCDVTKDDLPRNFDAILCFDVLEHLEEYQVSDVLSQLGSSGHSIVLTVSNVPLASLHLTVRSPGWWLNQVLHHRPAFEWTAQVWQRYAHCPSQVTLLTGKRST